MDKYIATRELVGMPGMPKTKAGVIERARRERWNSRSREAGRGGGREYLVSDLPTETRLAIAAKRMPATATSPTIAGANLPAPAAAAVVPATAAAGEVATLPERGQDVAALAEWQRDAAYARGALIKHVEHLRREGGFSLAEAVDALNRQAEAGDEDMAALLARANERPRAGAPRLTYATFHRWAAELRDGGFGALAPRPTHRAHIPDWAPEALRLNANPAKLNLRLLHEQLVARLAEIGFSGAAPSYGQVRRFMTRDVGAVARQVGRMGPRELLNVLPHVRRDRPEWPADIYGADGHTFDAFVMHWDGRSKLRPEVTLVIDCCTRKAVGVSFGDFEGTAGVLEAQRRAFMTHGICAHWYVDRGPGFKNKVQNDELLGVAARIGFEISHALPYRSQARGFIERAHQSILVRAARELPTYVGKDMDREAAARVHKIDRARVKRMAGGVALPTWDEFVAFVLRKIDAYNDRPHRSLPKARWPDGETRHMSPNMAWADAVRRGWTPHLLSAEDARDLARPYTIRKVERGEIKFANKVYFHAALTEYNGALVGVGYDFADPRTIVVREAEGTRRWICDAVLDGNRRPFFPESKIEEGRRKRHEAVLRRLDEKREQVLDQMAFDGAAAKVPAKKFDWSVIEHHEQQPQGASEAAGSHKPGQAGSTPAPATNIESIVPEEAAADDARPTFHWNRDRYEWLMAHRDRWNDTDRAFVAHYTASSDYALLREVFEADGIAWTGGDVPAGFRAAV